MENIQENIKILLIEDDDIDVMAFKRALRKAQIQHNIEVYQNPKEAIRAIEDHGKSFDCIFLDYQLPGSNGLVILERIKNLGLLVPV
ncbi:MAG: response regulator, partial [Bacteroidota bacterium]|nr:response regulator [Bacteroidota bacterium]